MGSSPTAEEQGALLEEAFGFVAEQRFYLRKAINQSDLDAALRCAICLANELRSSQLAPENYYKLYALVSWELQHFGGFVATSASKEQLDLAQVYELVQHEGNALPRLYLLVTVGSVYVCADGGKAQEILDDLTSMLCAVQHPVRGLFLRYYFLQVVKDSLPLLGAREAVRYLLLNLRESISLWARLRLQPASVPSRGQGPEEGWQLDRGRHVLRLLVGAHLMRLARLPGLNPEVYAEAVLPEVLRLSTSCEDSAGQAYLLRCFVEVFPDDFHLKTLDRVLVACGQVHWAVDLRPVLEHLLRRLTLFVLKPGSGEETAGADPFASFHGHLRQLHARPRGPATPLGSLLGLQLELMLATLALHPGDPGRVELVLHGTAGLLRQQSEGEAWDELSIEAVVDILAAPLTKEALVPAVLAMPHHATLAASLGAVGRRTAGLAMVAALLAGDVSLSDLETLHRLLALIEPLICDERAAEGVGEEEGSACNQKHLEHDPVAFAAEQERVARLAHQVRHPDAAEAFRMLAALRRYFDEGGPHRVVFTLPATAVAALRLAEPLLAGAGTRVVVDAGDMPEALAAAAAWPTPEEFFDFVQETIAGLGSLQPAESVRLRLLAAATADAAARRAAEAAGSGEGPAAGPAAAAAAASAACRSLVDGALRGLEREVRSAGDKLVGLQLVAGTLRGASCLEGPCFALAADRAVQIARQLESKRLQSKGLCLCAAMFWGPACRDAGQAMLCLQRALRCADGAIHIDPLDVGLFVEVLDRAAQLFDEANTEVTASFLSCLLALCAQHLQYIGDRAPVEAAQALRATVLDLQERQARAVAGGAALAAEAAGYGRGGLTRRAPVAESGTARVATAAAEAEALGAAAAAVAAPDPVRERLAVAAGYAALHLEAALEAVGLGQGTAVAAA